MMSHSASRTSSNSTDVLYGCGTGIGSNCMFTWMLSAFISSTNSLPMLLLCIISACISMHAGSPRSLPNAVFISLTR